MVDYSKLVYFPWYFDKKNLLPLNTTGVKETDFYPADNEYTFKNSLAKMPDDWHYKTKKVRYKLNSLGYRAPEFNTIDWKNAIVLFGCSCTFGIGVDESETVSHYLSNITGRPVVNLGWPGGSNEMMMYNSLLLKQNYETPYAVVCLWSTTDRFIMFSDFQPYNVGPWNEVENQSKVKYKDYRTDVYTKAFESINFFSENEGIRNYMTAELTKEIWKNSTIYVSSSFFSYKDILNLDLTFSIDNEARDLVHPGRKSNQEAAEKIANFINEKSNM
jgi:hypothetical protein